MATQEIPSGNGVKNISVPRSDAYIKIEKKNGSRLLPSGSILSIANSIPSIFQILFLPLFKIKNFMIGSTNDDRRDSHNSKANDLTHEHTKGKRKRGERKREGE